MLSTFIFQGSVHAADKIRIAYSADTGSLLFLLAHKKGFLRAEGVDAEVIRMTGNVPVAALVSGEIDYHTALGTSVRAAIQGLPLRVIAAYREGSGWVLASRTSIKSVPELKGKVIAVGNPGSGPDTNGRIMVKHFGLERDRDVKFVAAAEGLPEGRLLRVQQGFIDATVVPIPADLSKKLGLNVIARSYEIYKTTTFGLVTTTRKIKEKRDEVKRIIIAGIKASRYIRANRDQTVQSLMELFRTDREMAGANYEYLSKTLNDNGSPTDNGFRLLIEDIKESAKVTRDVSVSEVADLSILWEAQRELGIKAK
ncbi:MAG TPA: ABC transporter substrate-binding protein [Candidatus Acidoferrum sp.]|nr:ABC transporter substrate-binding protein [Candidatus Acidoferrum sp.]